MNTDQTGPISQGDFEEEELTQPWFPSEKSSSGIPQEISASSPWEGRIPLIAEPSGAVLKPEIILPTQDQSDSLIQKDWTGMYVLLGILLGLITIGIVCLF